MKILTAKAFRNMDAFNDFLEENKEIKRTYVSMLQVPINDECTRIYVVEYYIEVKA